MAQLDTVKVIEYERGEARIRQTPEVRPAVADLLKRLQIPLPPKRHRVEPVQAAQQYDRSRRIARKSLKRKAMVCLDAAPPCQTRDSWRPEFG